MTPSPGEVSAEQPQAVGAVGFPRQPDEPVGADPEELGAVVVPVLHPQAESGGGAADPAPAEGQSVIPGQPPDFRPRLRVVLGNPHRRHHQPSTGPRARSRIALARSIASSPMEWPIPGTRRSSTAAPARAEHPRGPSHAFRIEVRIGVTAGHQDGGPLEGAFGIAAGGGFRGAHVRAAEDEDASPAPRVAECELGADARALGEAAEEDPLSGDPAAHQTADQLFDDQECRGKRRFIRLQGREVALGVPDVAGGLGSEPDEPGIAEVVGDPEDVLGGCPPPVQKDRPGACAGDVLSRLQHRLILVDRFGCHGFRIYPVRHGMTNGLTGGRPHVRAEARGRAGAGGRTEQGFRAGFPSREPPRDALYFGYRDAGGNRMAWATGETAGSEETAQSEEHRYRAIFQHSAVSLWEEDITELRAAIQALQADGVPSLSGYLDAHPEFLRQATKLIRVIDVNDATLRLYGVPRKEDLLGSLDITLDLDDPLMLTSIRDEILKIAEGKNLYTHESTAVTPGGRKLNIIVEAQIPGPDDSYPHMLVSVIDVTEQRRAEEALRESERELHRSQQMLRSVLDNIPQRVFWKDPALRFLGCNTAFADDGGVMDPSAIVGLDDYQMPWRSMAERYRADDRRVLATGAHLLNYEEPQVLSDGRELWVRTNKVPLRDREGKVVGLLGTYEDITERIDPQAQPPARKDSSADAHRQPARLRLPQGPGEQVRPGQPGNRALHGRGEPRAAHREDRRDFYPPQDAEKFAADERCVIDEGRSIVNLEESIVTPVGSVRRVLTTKVPLVDAEGRTTGLVGIGRDITEIRDTEAALRKSGEQLQLASKLEAVGRLAGGIAHDFNNLLTVIEGYADLLVGSLAEKSPLRPDIQQIKRSAQRAGDLTAQLLAFSRRQVRTPRVISLNEVVRGMEGMLARLIGEDIQLVTRYAEGLGNIRADPGQIEQVMMNLAANARDAMPLGGRITVETSNGTLGSGSTPPQFASVPGEFVLLAVSDTGEGMDPRPSARSSSLSSPRRKWARERAWGWQPCTAS